jgi:hypothetical protein
VTTLRRPGKAPISAGDTVKVSSAVLTVGGVSFRDRGWTGIVIRLEDDHAVVEQSRRGRYGHAGVRRVRLDRLTRRYRADVK